jgi:hypothetical protein
MFIESKSERWVSSAAVLLLLCLSVTGCTPYQPRNHREEGPDRGIFSGAKGEFVIPLPGEPTKEGEKTKTTAGESSQSE